MVNRQRSVNRLLKEEFRQIHALSLSARTPAEHDESNRHSTPPCAGKSWPENFLYFIYLTSVNYLKTRKFINWVWKIAESLEMLSHLLKLWEKWWGDFARGRLAECGDRAKLSITTNTFQKKIKRTFESH